MEHAVRMWTGEIQRQNKVEKMDYFAFRSTANVFLNHLVIYATAESVKDIKCIGATKRSKITFLQQTFGF